MSEDRIEERKDRSAIEELAVYILDLLEDDDNIFGDGGSAAGQEVIARTERGRWAQQTFYDTPEAIADYVGDFYYELCFYPARERAVVEALELVIEAVRTGEPV